MACSLDWVVKLPPAAKVGNPLGSVCDMRRGQMLWLAAAVGWTVFVWVGRVRNALGDASMDAATLTGVLLLSATFLLGALVVAVMAWRGRATAPGIALVRVVWLMAAWNTVVWASRITDIAVAGDHDIAFVAVHTVIGLLSIMLWAITAFSLVERRSEEIAPMS